MNILSKTCSCNDIAEKLPKVQNNNHSLTITHMTFQVRSKVSQLTEKNPPRYFITQNYYLFYYYLQKKWLQKMYLTDFKNHLLKCFPYYVHLPAKKKDKSDNVTMQVM
jgi:hypothetical protein